MKSLFSKFALVVFAALSLTACESWSQGNIETAAPYEMERTAKDADKVEVKQTETVQRVETKACPPAPRPMCPTCPDVSAMQNRIAMLESQLRQCNEKVNRMQDTVRNGLMK